MFKFIYKNSEGNAIELGQSAPFFITSKEGLGGVDNDITSVTQFNMDGSYFIGQRLSTRQIVLHGELLGNSQSDVDELRQRLASVFTPQLNGNLRYEVGNKIYAIDVLVDVTPDFDSKQKNLTIGYVIKLTALQPYWYDVTEYNKLIPLSKIDGVMTWPLRITNNYIFSKLVSGIIVTVNNSGDIPTGAIFTIDISGAVTNLKILNIATNDYFKIIGTFTAGQQIILSTMRGKLAVRKKTADGYDINIVGNREAGSSFFELKKGENYIQVLADSGQNLVNATMKFTPLVVGV
ncbi:phage tail domain-containing protein [Leuconostoc citreum]